MRKSWLGVATLLVGLGFGVVSGHADSIQMTNQYSTKRSQNVRLVWRKSMGRHAYKNKQLGGRYSKHLGMRYSVNTMTGHITWYTDAHEKLYDKTKKKATIYYHVRNADNSKSGWIWRGYLTPTVGSNDPDKLALRLIDELGGLEGAHADATTMAQAKVVVKQMMSPTYHFVNNKGENYDNFVESTPAKSNQSDANARQYQQLLKKNQLVYGYGMNKAICVAAIGTKDQLTSDLYDNFVVDENWGIPEDTFYSKAKIGIATLPVANAKYGRYAMFVIVRLPASYENQIFVDE